MTVVLTAAAITCARLGPVIDEKGGLYGTLTPQGFICPNNWQGNRNFPMVQVLERDLHACEQTLTYTPVNKFYIWSHQKRKSRRWATQKNRKKKLMAVGVRQNKKTG